MKSSRINKIIQAALGSQSQDDDDVVHAAENIENMQVLLLADDTSRFDVVSEECMYSSQRTLVPQDSQYNVTNVSMMYNYFNEDCHTNLELFSYSEPLNQDDIILTAESVENMQVLFVDNSTSATDVGAEQYVESLSLPQPDKVTNSITQSKSHSDNNVSLVDYNISDDSNCDLQLVPYSEHSDSNSDEEQNKVKRRKRCQTNKSTWNDQKNKVNREKGKQYNGRKKVDGKWEKTLKQERLLKPRCKCKTNNKTALKCNKFSVNERKIIFDKFWRMTWGEKKVFVNSFVQMIPTKRPRDRKDPSISKRECSMMYYLNLNDERLRVCKTMFQNTLSITKMTIWNWKKGKKDVKEPGNEITRKNPHQAEVEALKEFLNSIPKMESHYCRKSTNKLYLLPEWTSKKALYDLYRSNWCTLRNITPLSIAKFNNTLEIENISLFKPKKDECEKCLSHKLGNIADTDHKLHIERKNEARIEKEKDKSTEEFVFTMDTQAVLLAPKSNVSSLYYKTKLCTHNFCIFNLKTKEGYCYLWNETKGGLSSDDYATIIVKFISEKILPSINRETDIKIILYSDGCAAQNRNTVLANSLLNLAMIKQITIEQKYLEVGHTQMEADSMHATIERKLKNKVIHVPAEYVEVCLKARKYPKPYTVSYLTHDFFKSFAEVQFYKSIRPGKATGDAKVTDIRALQYTKDGNINFKLRFGDEWQLLPQRRNKAFKPVSMENLRNLHPNRLKIKNRKYQDLQELKSTLPADYRDYYDNIPYEE